MSKNLSYIMITSAFCILMTQPSEAGKGRVRVDIKSQKVQKKNANFQRKQKTKTADEELKQYIKKQEQRRLESIMMAKAPTVSVPTSPAYVGHFIKGYPRLKSFDEMTASQQLRFIEKGIADLKNQAKLLEELENQIVFEKETELSSNFKSTFGEVLIVNKGSYRPLRALDDRHND